MPIKGLIFDAYGTLYDVHSVHAKTEELCPGKGDLITQIWRLKQLEYTWLQTSLQEYRDFTYLTRVSLEFALRAAGVEPSENVTKPLFEKSRSRSISRSNRGACRIKKARRLTARDSVKRQYGDVVGFGQELRY